MVACAKELIRSRRCVLMLMLCSLVSCSYCAAAAEMRDLIGQVDVYSTTTEEVIELLGEPLAYRWGDKTFTEDNLPSVYIMTYPENIHIAIVRGKVNEVRFEGGPGWYVFGENIRIGSSLEDVFEELGPPKAIVDNQPYGPLDLTLYRNLSTGKWYYRCADRDVRLFLRNNAVTAIYLWQGRGPSAYRPRELSQYADVRKRDIRNVDLSKKLDLVSTLTFNGRTLWPAKEKLPEGFDPQAWIEAAMNPGLKIRTLNSDGITGKGVSIGVIGYGLNTGHPEFAGRIAWYCDLTVVKYFRQDGAAIAGLLVGGNCGIAPQADLYYCAIKTNPSESDYVEALARLIDKNKSLPAERNIRVICVPAAPDDGKQKSKPGQETWNDACVAAEQAGILIIDGTHKHGIIRQCSYDPAAPDDISACIPGQPDKTPVSSPDNLYAPTSPRTVPEHIGKDGYDYAYYARGEPSWSIPYCVGVLALGWQLNPQLTGEEMIELLYETAYVNPDGAKIIYPLMFVTEVAKTERKD